VKRAAKTTMGVKVLWTSTHQNVSKSTELNKRRKQGRDWGGEPPGLALSDGGTHSYFRVAGAIFRECQGRGALREVPGRESQKKGKQ